MPLPGLVAPRVPQTSATASGGLAHVTVLGGSAFDVALRCARASLEVVLVEPDPVDAARLADMAACAGAGLLIAAKAPLAPRHALLLCAPDWAGELPDDGLRIDEGFCLTGEALELWRAPPEAFALAGRLGLVAIAVPRPGLAAALMRALEHTALGLILDGAVSWELDDALCDAGFSAGPFMRQDADGVDGALARLTDPGPVMPRMVAEGRLGRKVGVGWYRYPGGGGRVVDPLIEDLVREEARFAGRKARPVSDAECVARLTLAMMQAALDLTQRGFDPSIIDKVAVAGLGYPAQWGGPLWHMRNADRRALLRQAQRCGVNLALDPG